MNLAAEQEKTVTEKWLPDLKTAVLNAQKSLEDCKYVRGLVSSNKYYITSRFPAMYCSGFYNPCVHVLQKEVVGEGVMVGKLRLMFFVKRPPTYLKT